MLLKIGNDTIYFRHRETNLLVSSRWKTSCAWENPGSSFQMAQRWVNWWRYPNKCMPSNITNLSSFIVRVFHVRLVYTLENMDWQAWDLWDTCTLRNSKIGIQTEFLSMALITQHTQTYVIKTSSWLRNLLVSHLPPTPFGWPWAVHRLGGPAIFQLRSLGWQKDAKVVVDVFLKFILRGFCQ